MAVVGTYLLCLSQWSSSFGGSDLNVVCFDLKDCRYGNGTVDGIELQAKF